MQQFIDQANHNQALHDEIHRAFPNQYPDWKTTILFYVAIHLLKALASKWGVNLGKSHESIADSIKPAKTTYGPQPEMKISVTSYDNYQSLYNYSRSARYVAGRDPELVEEDYQRSVKCANDFRRYVEGLLAK